MDVGQLIALKQRASRSVQISGGPRSVQKDREREREREREKEREREREREGMRGRASTSGTRNIFSFIDYETDSWELYEKANN